VILGGYNDWEGDIPFGHGSTIQEILEILRNGESFKIQHVRKIKCPSQLLTLKLINIVIDYFVEIEYKFQNKLFGAC